MKRSKDMKNYSKRALLLGVLSMMAGSAGAVDVYLAAKPFTKDLLGGSSSPGGASVPMWGYVVEDGTCYNAADTLTRLACVNSLLKQAIRDPYLGVSIVFKKSRSM